MFAYLVMTFIFAYLQDSDSFNNMITIIIFIAVFILLYFLLLGQKNYNEI